MEDVKEVMNRLGSDPHVMKCEKKFIFADGRVNYSAIIKMCDDINKRYKNYNKVAV